MIELLEKAATKKVLFVGETIIDEYHYVRPLGRPLKESIVSVEHVSTECFSGGVVAAAKHATAICNHVDLFTDGQRIRKQRWVEASHIRKLFEMYLTENQTSQPYPPSFKDYDCIIVTDYGHGMMTPHLIEMVCSEAKFLAVNVQTNSGNYGFNLATKYPRADYLVVDEPEARLATQNRWGRIEESLEKLYKIFPMSVITLGRDGAVGIWGGVKYRSAAFTDKVIDTLGAGDAFFAITAPLANHVDMQELLKIGNAAGAIKAGIVGHRQSVTKDELVRVLESVS